MHLFYDKGISGDFHVLNEDESRHCLKVLRLVNGDEVFITDGIGNLFKTVIAEIHQKKTILKITDCKHEFGKENIIFILLLHPLR